MKKSENLFLLIAFLLIAICTYFYVFPLLKNSNEPLTKEVAELTIDANLLVKSFAIDEQKSNELYAGKIIEVTGTIKEITYYNNRTTIILNHKNRNSFGVICDLNHTEEKKSQFLKPNQKIRVKGICKGYLKDVILLNCSIEVLTNE
ncbi:OB-fold protein [Polaribacter marinivivus]|uniref:tRNA_anti-like n=1 Tax=Polaribacter marinivivus TaxID=1524260 RepID=A0ABV8R8V3_9FLAO|nr:hypothetical protein [uncultured Polaribacter sp.]